MLIQGHYFFELVLMIADVSSLKVFEWPQKDPIMVLSDRSSYIFSCRFSVVLGAGIVGNAAPVTSTLCQRRVVGCAL